eukprot:scaffold162302_cov32-Tisochrysis_lutea.AAC.3
MEIISGIVDPNSPRVSTPEAPGLACSRVRSRCVRKEGASSNLYISWPPTASDTPTMGTRASIAVTISSKQYGLVRMDLDWTTMRQSEFLTDCWRSRKSRKSSESRKHLRPRRASISVWRKRASMAASTL